MAKKMKINIAGLGGAAITAGAFMLADTGLEKMNEQDFMAAQVGEDGTVPKWNVKKIGVNAGVTVLGAALSVIKNDHVHALGAGILAAGANGLKNNVIAGLSDVGMGNTPASRKVSGYMSMYDTMKGDIRDQFKGPGQSRVMNIR